MNTDDQDQFDDLPEIVQENEDNPITQLEQERDEARDKMLRALAELENYRSRVNRERNEERKYASIELFRALLPIWDNISRALEAAESSHNLDSLIEGIQMVDKQLLTVFAQFGCERIETIGKPFDPNFHASISQMPSNDYEPNTVIHEAQAGFKLYERIVRPAQVVLATANS
ncbi:MAG: nucleotide exchange factor GrpE [Planctomycetaceae bacterium]|jgi:molecular chaperone GrpE|nr:nucleotide exchange factor GrpE [Planctomycetaceae bacterium]